MPIRDWAQFAFSVTFVFLLLAACLWWLAKRKGGFLVNRDNKPIQVVDTLALGIKHKLMLVKVKSEMILVSVTPNEIQKLHAWRDEEGVNPSAVNLQTPLNKEQKSSGNFGTSAVPAAQRKNFKDSLEDAHGHTDAQDKARGENHGPN